MENYYSGGDYAGIDSDNLCVYYGYECVDDSGNWCFKATFNGQQVQWTWEELGSRDQFDCQYGLLAGIARLFSSYRVGERGRNQPCNH